MKELFPRSNRWGQLEAIVMATVGETLGKVMLVAASTDENYDKFTQLVDYDKDGDVRLFSTIDAAVNGCVANRGDVILVAPGHTESITGATSLVLDTADITIVGLGEGNRRPTLTYTTAATATLPVSAASVRLKNFILNANFADIVAAITLTSGADFTLESCLVKANAASVNFLALVETSTVDNAADGLTLKDVTWIEPDVATTSMVNVDADLDRLTITGCYVNLGVNTNDLPALVEVATGKDVTNVLIEDNDVIRLNDANPLLLTADTTTANTGIIKNNRVRHLDTAAELLATAGTSFGYFGNLATAAVDASGYTLPAVDS